MKVKTLSLVSILFLFVSACSGGSETPTPHGETDAADQGVYEALDGNGGPDGTDAVDEDTGPPLPTDCDADVDCDDANPCTFESCQDGKCVFQNLTGDSCDDGDSCTITDQCAEGSCSGVLMDCDDNNGCTIDSCKEGVCQAKAESTDECKLRINVTAPKRGATYHDTGAIEITGSVDSPAGPVQNFTINGAQVTVKSDGSFDHALFAVPGINMVTFQAKDILDRTDKGVRAFLYAEELYQTGDDKAVVFMPSAARSFFRSDVWDDNDISDADDFATVIHKVAETIDVGKYIPTGIVYETALCTWTIDISSIGYQIDYVDLKTTTGALELSGGISAGHAWFDAVAPFCPDGHGWLYAGNISFNAKLDVGVNNGNLVIDVISFDVEISQVSVDVQEGAASYFDWVLNWFTNSYANKVEEQLETYLPDEVLPILVSLLNGFVEKEQVIDIPAIPGTTSSLPLVLRTKPQVADFTPAGSVFEVSVGIGSKKLIAHPAPGSFKRGDCKGTETGTFYLPKSQKLEVAVSEDFLNQTLFALWWGGHLSISLTSDILDPLLEGFDVTGLVVKLDPYLPPIYTSCTESGEGEFQLGDMNVWASFSIGDQNGEVEMFTTAKVEAEVVVVPSPAGNQLGLAVGDVTATGIDIISSKGVMEGADALLEQLLSELVVDVLIKNYLVSVLAAYPIPEFDLGTLGDFFPPQTVVGFEPVAAAHNLGFVVLSGSPK
jgi:hypothetical protein